MRSPTSFGAKAALQTPTLVCVFVAGNDESSERGSLLTLKQEKGKKSSFLVDCSDASTLETTSAVHANNACFALASPVKIVVENRGSVARTAVGNSSNGTSAAGQPQAFVLGGFQIVSNARQVEVYTTDTDGHETYVMTSKGIAMHHDTDSRIDDNRQNGTRVSTGSVVGNESGRIPPLLHKAVCVIPGGPKQVQKLCIKLLGLRYHDGQPQDSAFVQMIKVTARIPEPKSPRQSPNMKADTAVSASASNGAPSTQNRSPAMFAQALGTGMNSKSPANGTPSPTMAMLQQQFLKQQQRQQQEQQVRRQHHLGSSHGQSSKPSLLSSADAPQSIDKEDLGAAMTTMSILARSTEDRMEKAMREQMKHLGSTISQSSRAAADATAKAASEATARALASAMEQQSRMWDSVRQELRSGPMHDTNASAGAPSDQQRFMSDLLQKLHEEQRQQLELMFQEHVSPLHRLIVEQSQLLQEQARELANEKQRVEDMQKLLQTSVENQTKLQGTVDTMMATLVEQKHDRAMIDLNSVRVTQPSLLDSPAHLIMDDNAPNLLMQSVAYTDADVSNGDGRAVSNSGSSSSSSSSSRKSNTRSDRLVGSTPSVNSRINDCTIVLNQSTDLLNLTQTPSIWMDQTMATLPSLPDAESADKSMALNGTNLLGIEEEKSLGLTAD